MDRICTIVEPGICGFTCRIEAWQKEKRIAGLRIEASQCEMIKRLAKDLVEISLKDLFLPIARNPVFISTQRAGCHPACPVPAGIVKTAEAALGLAVPKDAVIRFEKCDGSEQEIQPLEKGINP